MTDRNFYMATTSKKHTRMDQFAVNFALWVLQNRILVILAVIIFVIACASGSRFLGFDTDYRVFFSKENPQLKAFDELQRVYTKTDNAVFVLKPKSGTIFEENTIAAVQELTQESWKLPFSSRVDSLSNYQHTYANGDNLTVIDLIEKPADELHSDDMAFIKDVAMNEPLIQHRLVSPDGDTTGVNITFYFPGESPFEVPNTANKIRELLATVQTRYPDIEIVASGVVMMNNAFSEVSQNDMKTLIPIMYGVLLITMLLFLRCISSTIATLLVIAFSAAAAMGVAGWFGVKLTPPSASAPTIILTLAIADSIHIIVSLFKEMQKGTGKREAIIESVRINFQPVLLTSFTTAIGFLSLNFSDAPPFRDLGNMTAVGIIFAFFFSILLLPAILSFVPVRCGTNEKGHHKWIDDLGAWVVKKRKILLPTMSVIVVLCAFMIPRMEINDEFVQYFDEGVSFRDDAEFMMEHLTGIYLVEYSLGAENSQGINDPTYLERMEAFANWLREQPEVQHVYSLTDVFKRLNKNMHGDNPEWYTIPSTREMAAQYLLLYEFSLPYGLDLNDRINVDKSATRLTATLYDMSTNEIKAFKRKSEQWLKENTPSYMHTEATSPVVMFAYISERNIHSMLKGNTIALFLISLTILIALRSFTMGVFSLIPNLTPALMGFGIWALFVSQINMAVAFVAAISLGIIVDDTVHFLSKYYRARREKGLHSHEAVRYAFSTVGSALVITTFILICGFSILMLSVFKINFVMGTLTALIIACALIADMLLLPPLLMLADRKIHKESDYAEATI